MSTQKEDQKLVFKTDYRLMQVKNIAECSKREHSSILSTFIKLQFVIKIFVLCIFEWPLKTGLTVSKWHMLANMFLDSLLFLFKILFLTSC